MSERDEATTKASANLWALVAEMNGLLAHMEGIKADNAQAAIDTGNLLYLSDSFGVVSTEFDSLAKRFREI